MIKPTVGRKVWYRPSPHDLAGAGGLCTAGGQPLDATIVCVWSDTMVNLVVFDANGNMFRRPSVTLLQDDAVPLPNQSYAEWMPYQQGQARQNKEIA